MNEPVPTWGRAYSVAAARPFPLSRELPRAALRRVPQDVSRVLRRSRLDFSQMHLI